MGIQINAPDTKVGNSKKVPGYPNELEMRIRVFWPNSISHSLGGIDYISQEYIVDTLEVNDPIYHQLVFIDNEGRRHQIVGLAYHIIEEAKKANGIDAIV
jgi:hypothetical protein